MRQIVLTRMTAGAAAIVTTTTLGGSGGIFCGFRSCHGFGTRALSLHHHDHRSAVVSVSSLLSLSPVGQQQQHHTRFPPRDTTVRLLASSSSSSSSFSAPAPPNSQGISVFPDVDSTKNNSKNTSSAHQRNDDPKAVYVVTGASRGIGYQFVRKLLDHTKGTIIACCRSPSTATQLQNLMAEDPSFQQRIDVVHLDLEDPQSIQDFGTQIKTKYTRVDMLLNVAGILGGDGGGKNGTGAPERSYSKIEYEWLHKSMTVNCLAPVMLTQVLVPLMTTTKKTQAHDDRPAVALVVNLSARVGSISDNGLGGWYSYRMSKAALNQATRTYANELKSLRNNVYCIALHPGTTDTDLSKPFQKNVSKERLFPVEFTVNCLMDVIDSVTIEHTGGLYDWSGKSIPF